MNIKHEIDDAAVENSRQPATMGTFVDDNWSQAQEPNTEMDQPTLTNSFHVIRKVHNKSKHLCSKEDPGMEQYECKVCGCKFKSKRFLKRHTSINSRNYECATCAYKTTCKTTLISHTKLHMSENNYECELCGFRSVYKVGFISHIKMHTGSFRGANPKECPTCGFKAVRARDLDNHIRLRSGEPYKCSLCGYKTNQSCAMKLHIQSHTQDAPYECVVCGFKTVHSRDLTKHVANHLSENPLSCPICGYGAKQVCDFKLHMKTHTSENNTCRLCGFKSGRGSDMKSHMKSHTVEKLYKCSSCDYKTAYVSTLAPHQKVHTDSKPYECSICGFKTKYACTLRIHVSSRRCAKTECPNCEFKAKNMKELVKHQRTHNATKGYVCSICKHETVYEGALRTHMLRHSDDNPYKCLVCGYKAANKRNLKTHKRVHAEGKPDEYLYKAFMQGKINSQITCKSSYLRNNIIKVNVKKEPQFESSSKFKIFGEHSENIAVKTVIPELTEMSPPTDMKMRIAVDEPANQEISIKQEIDIEPNQLQLPDIAYKTGPKQTSDDSIVKSENDASSRVADGNEKYVITVKREDENVADLH